MPSVTPVEPGTNCDDCDTCCSLFGAVKEFTKYKNGSPITVSCTKLYWNCKCPGASLKMQLLGSTWSDLDSSTFSPASNYWYALPSLSSQTYRLKCTLAGGFTYYSNQIVVVPAVWDCQCEDVGNLKKLQANVNVTFYPESAPGVSSGSSYSATWSFPINNASTSNISLGFSGALPILASRLQNNPNKITLVLQSGSKLTGANNVNPTTFDTSSRTYELNLGDGDPCTHFAPCYSGTISASSSTGSGNFWAGSYSWNGFLWTRTFWGGYSTIDSVTISTITC